MITTEQGKTLADAEGDVLRGLQVVENLCANTSLLLGETLTGISKDMDLTSYRIPLGVCAGIAPFNFPAMIPLWMFPTGEHITEIILRNLFHLSQVVKMYEIQRLPSSALDCLNCREGGATWCHKQYFLKMLSLFLYCFT